MNLSESYKQRLKELAGMAENFNIIQNTLEISEPYADVEKIIIGDKIVYILFGDVDYYQNRESILAIKRKSNELNLDHKSYQNFLSEFHRRFKSIRDLSESDLVISVETTSPVTEEMGNALQIPFVKNGFKKLDSSFKMRSVAMQDRGNIKDLFSFDLPLNDKKRICVMDDFITTGTTFKNAFDKIPPGIISVGVCLFKLKS